MKKIIIIVFLPFIINAMPIIKDSKFDVNIAYGNIIRGDISFQSTFFYAQTNYYDAISYFYYYNFVIGDILLNQYSNFAFIGYKNALITVLLGYRSPNNYIGGVGLFLSKYIDINIYVISDKQVLFSIIGHLNNLFTEIATDSKIFSLKIGWYVNSSKIFYQYRKYQYEEQHYIGVGYTIFNKKSYKRLKYHKKRPSYRKKYRKYKRQIIFVRDRANSINQANINDLIAIGISPITAVRIISIKQQIGHFPDWQTFILLTNVNNNELVLLRKYFRSL